MGKSSIIIDELNSKIKSTLSWMNDAEKREDFNEYSYYEGKLSVFREILNILVMYQDENNV